MNDKALAQPPDYIWNSLKVREDTTGGLVPKQAKY